MGLENKFNFRIVVGQTVVFLFLAQCFFPVNRMMAFCLGDGRKNGSREVFVDPLEEGGIQFNTTRYTFAIVIKKLEIL